MRNRYLVVLNTYEHRIRSSWSVALLILGGLVWMVVPLFNQPSRRDPVFIPVLMLLSGLAFYIPMLWLHVHEQLVNPHQRLMASYTRPHVIVFLIISFLIVIAWPALVTVVHHSHSIVMIASSAFAFAYIGWCVTTRSAVLSCVGVIGAMSLIFAPHSPAMLKLLSEPHETIAGFVLTGAIVAVALALVRMTRLTEEDRGYYRQQQANPWNVRPRMTGDTERVWAEADKKNWLPMQVRYDTPYIPQSRGRWEAVRRCRSTLPVSFWWIICVTAMVGASGMIFYPYSHSLLPPVSGFLALMPTMMLCFAWFKQWQYLESESLKPVSRPELIKTFGLSVGVTMLQAWAVCSGALILLSARNGMPNPVAFLSFLMMLFCLQVFLFGLFVWIARHRSQIKLVVTYMLVFMPILAFSNSAPEFSIYQRYGLELAIGFAVAGIALAMWAYRQWLGTELG